MFSVQCACFSLSECYFKAVEHCLFPFPRAYCCLLQECKLRVREWNLIDFGQRRVRMPGQARSKAAKVYQGFQTSDEALLVENRCFNN